jgi:hypothetical protein
VRLQTFYLRPKKLRPWTSKSKFDANFQLLTFCHSIVHFIMVKVWKHLNLCSFFISHLWCVYNCPLHSPLLCICKLCIIITFMHLKLNMWTITNYVQHHTNDHMPPIWEKKNDYHINTSSIYIHTYPINWSFSIYHYQLVWQFDGTFDTRIGLVYKNGCTNTTLVWTLLGFRNLNVIFYPNSILSKT